MKQNSIVEFMDTYEAKTNTHDFSHVAPLIHPRAIYFFSDGTFKGRSAIQKAFEKTWKSIKDEKYIIKNLHILVQDKDVAVVTYDFSWRGYKKGRPASGRGRGTNTLIKVASKWKMIGEHLSV